MEYQNALAGFFEQFKTEFSVVNEDKLRPFKRIIIAGMGGSRLAPDMLRMLNPEMGIHVHSDYDLPAMSPETLLESLIIANSHSGDTAETISAAEEALRQGLNLAIVTTGGKLGSLAKEHAIPHILTPQAAGMPARLSFGYSYAALCRLLNLESSVSVSNELANWAKETGTKMAEVLDGKVPLIFGPRSRMESVYVWKIILNETAKVPAFCNRLPEMDHNELAGYDRDNNLCGNFSAIIINDPKDERMARRIKATAEVMRENEIPTERIDIPEADMAAQAVTLALTAHWTAYELAKRRGVDPAEVPVIEKLKTAMR